MSDFHDNQNFKSPSLVEGNSGITEDQVFMHLMERVLNMKPNCVKILKIWMNYHGIDDFHSIFDYWILITPGAYTTTLYSYRIGQKMHDLPHAVITKLHFLTLWALEQLTATKTFVSDSLWMTLTNTAFEQWCIASSYELPVDDEMTSTFVDITDNFDNWDLASFFDLPADDVITSTFLDMTNDFDEWNLGSLFEVPADDATVAAQGTLYIFEDFDNWNLASPFEPPANDATLLAHVVHYSMTSVPIAASTRIIKIGDCLSEHILTNKTTLANPSARKSQPSVVCKNGEPQHACIIKPLVKLNQDHLPRLPLMLLYMKYPNKQPIAQSRVSLSSTTSYTTTSVPHIAIAHSTISLSPDGGELLHVHLHDTSYCPSVAKSLELYHHGKKTPTLLSPLQGKCYNMAQKRLQYIHLENKKVISSHGQLCTTSSEPTHICNRESSPDPDVHHTKTQDSICYEYFAASSQLKHLIAQTEPVNKAVVCQDGEQTHNQEPKYMEEPNEDKEPSKAIEHTG